MAENVIVATFPEGEREVILEESLWQWDYGQVLRFGNLELPVPCEVHFANSGTTAEAALSMAEGNDVNIPDAVLQTGKPVYAWVYLRESANDGETRYAVWIPVKRRNKPENIEFTEEQSDAAARVIVAVQNAAAQVSADAAAIEASVTAVNEAKDAALAAKEAAEAAQLAAETAGAEVEGYAQTAEQKAGEASNAERMAATHAMEAEQALEDVQTLADDVAGNVADAQTAAHNAADSEAEARRQAGLATAGAEEAAASAEEAQNIADALAANPKASYAEVTGVSKNSGTIILNIVKPENFENRVDDYLLLKVNSDVIADQPPTTAVINLHTNAQIINNGNGTYTTISASDEIISILNFVQKNYTAGIKLFEAGRVYVLSVREKNGQHGFVLTDYAPGIAEAAAEIEQAVEDVGEAVQSAEDFANTASNWATGKNLDGTPSSQHIGNNADYFARQAGQSADAAEDAKEAIEDMTVSATPLTASATPTATKTTDQQTGVVNIEYGLVPGTTYTPSVSGDGTLSFTNDGNKTNPAAVNIAEQIRGVFDEIVTGTDPVIVGVGNHRYLCGEVATIDITPPATGIIDVIFTSGTTPTVLTLPATILMPDWFDSTDLAAETVYEINICDGVWGAVMMWAL